MEFFGSEFTFIQPVSFGADESTALIIVDMQYHDASAEHGFTLALEQARPGSMSYYSERLEHVVVPTLAALLRYFRERGMPVIYLTLGAEYQDYRDLAPRFRGWLRALEAATGVADVFWAGNPAFAIRRELTPEPQDVVFRKRTFSGFNSSDLSEYLRYADISTLVLGGVTTNACIDSTARDAADRGYSCVIVEDATADYDETAHFATLNAFHFNFGRVASAAEVMHAIDGGTAV